MSRRHKTLNNRNTLQEERAATPALLHDHAADEARQAAAGMTPLERLEDDRRNGTCTGIDYRVRRAMLT